MVRSEKSGFQDKRDKPVPKSVSHYVKPVFSSREHKDAEYYHWSIDEPEEEKRRK
jgi:hypothetical protein